MDGIWRASDRWVIICSLSPGAQHAPSIAIPPLYGIKTEGQQVNKYIQHSHN